jgi:hypothetical protein
VPPAYISKIRRTTGPLFLKDFKLHAADREPTVLTALGRIFNREVAVSVALASRLEPVESSTFLSPVYLLREAYQKLLVHHPVKSQQGTRGLLSAIEPLCNRVDKYTVVLETVIHLQHVGKIARQP